MDEASGDGFDSFRNNFQEEGRDKTENSEDESGLNEKLVARPINNYRSLLDSDSDEDEVKSEVPGPKRQVLTSSDSENSRNSNGSIKKKIKKKRIQRRSDDSNSDSSAHSNRSSKQNKKKNSSSSSSDSDVNDPHIEISEKCKQFRASALKAMEDIHNKLDKENPGSMSNKTAADNMKVIQSESQRMARETSINVPYHKPKQHTLKEFLSRRSIQRPANLQNKKPMASIRMNKTELEEYAKKMEEREKEAIEFFKSETESEEEQEPEKHEAVNLADNGLVKLTDDPPVSENIDNPQISDETSQEIIKDIPEPELTESELEFKRLTEKYCGDSPIIEAVPGPSTYNPSNFNEVLSTMDEFDDIVDSDKDIVTKIETEKPRIPSLGTNNLIIDLESGDIAEKPLSGAEQLFKRFLKNTTIQKQKSSTCISVLNTEDGSVHIDKIVVKFDQHDDSVEHKPGFAHNKLKTTLYQKIRDKRRQELIRKLEEAEKIKKDAEAELEEFSDCGMSGEDEYDEEMSDSEVPDSIPATETLNSEIMDQQTDNISENIKKGEDSESESDEESSESEPEIEVDQTKKKTRIIAFVDSDDESNAPQTEEMIPVMNPIEDILQSPQPPSSSISTQPSQNFLRSQSDCFTDFTEPSVSERGNIENSENMKVLFDTQSPKQDFNRSVDDELLDICSGQFALTQSEAPGTSTVIAKGLFNQEDGGPFTQNFNHDVNNELLDLCSGPFSTQLNMQNTQDEIADSIPTAKNAKLLLASSEDESIEQPDLNFKRKKKLKKKKNQVKKLGFSDDESEDDLPQENQEEQIQESEESADELEAEPEEPEVFIDYDSEENEIEVKMSKQDKFKEAGKYFEAEAELSGDEAWGSADENEENLDKLDIELGDEDQFDQDLLQEEVGKIHMRRVLDDDIREVKKLQDRLFDNEEDDGVGRDRKFRWRNNPEGFSMDDENARDMELMGDELEDESEANWRKMRHEREMMIIEQNLNADNTQGEILLLDQNSQTVSTSNSMFLTKRKITVVKSAASMDQEAKANSPFLISKYNNSITSRSSFLSRDENTLSKLANFTKSTGETANPNSFVTNRGNFVFASLSPVANKTAEEATVRNKRKSEPTKITNDNKKQKVYVHSKKKLILDQLNN